MNKKQARQNRILHFIERKQQVSITDLLVGLGVDVSRKTLQRDLRELENKLLISKSGLGKSTTYSLSPRYGMLKEYDVENYYKTYFKNRKIKMQFNEEIFDLLDKNIFTQDELQKLENLNEKYIKTKNQLEKESPAIFRKEWERLIIEFSWKSSEIEGGTYTLLETEALIKEMHFAKGKDKLDAQMILNHKKALDFVLENKQYFKRLTLKKVNKMHEILTIGLDINFDFRDRIVAIGGTMYRPLFQKEEIIKAVGKMVKTINKIENPFIQAFVALVMIAYIQPFDDGNKRTSRMLANAMLYANDKAMLSYRDVDTVEYKKATLLFYEQNNISYFKKIFIEQFEFAVNEYFL